MSDLSVCEFGGCAASQCFVIPGWTGSTFSLIGLFVPLPAESALSQPTTAAQQSLLGVNQRRPYHLICAAGGRRLLYLPGTDRRRQYPRQGSTGGHRWWGNSVWLCPCQHVTTNCSGLAHASEPCEVGETVHRCILHVQAVYFYPSTMIHVILHYWRQTSAFLSLL